MAPPTNVVTSVVPSASGAPNSVVTWGTYEYVSVQGTGAIFRYNLASGVQVSAGTPYVTPCQDPSGMVVTAVGSTNVLAVTCWDTGQLLTLAMHTDGSLSALGAVGGLDSPYPGVALDGTDVLIPLFGQNHTLNGSVAKVSIANPAAPVVTAVAVLQSPVTGGYSNPGALAVANHMVYVAAGSEDGPLESSSSIQVVDDRTMDVVGSPLPVPHSPQRIAVRGVTAFVTVFDAQQLVAIDVSNPSKLQTLSTLPLGTCNALPLLMSATTAVVGCYGQGTLLSVDTTVPTSMRVQSTTTGFGQPQAIGAASGKAIIASGAQGGAVYVTNAISAGLSGTV